MEIKSILKNVKISARKARLVANHIRGLSVDKALDFLTFSKKKASFFFKSVLTSAIANAEHNANMDIDNLYIFTVYVDEGPTKKAFRARAKGRSNRILKRTSHLTVKLHEKD
jgi:large subunit ribosomal protein L22